MPTEPALQVTTPGEWGKKQVAEEEGFITELPSGNVIRMRRTMNMLTLLRQGRIPNPLASIVQKMIDTREINFNQVDADGKMAIQLLDMLDEGWLSAVIEPTFDGPEPRKPNESAEDFTERLNQWRPKEGAISVFDVDVQDKMYVFAVAQGAAADIARFREEQSAALESLEDVAEPPKPSKRTTARKRTSS